MLATHDRIELALARQLGEIATEGLQGRRLHVLLAILGTAPARRRSGGLFATARTPALGPARELGIELAKNLVPGALDVDIERLEHPGGHALTLAQQSEQDVLGAHVRVAERLGLLAREGEDLLDARRVGNAALGLRLGAGPHLLLDGVAHGLEVEAHLLEHGHGHALSELDQAEQDVLGAHVIVMEAVGFLAGEREHLLGARREVIHRFGHGRKGAEGFSPTWHRTVEEWRGQENGRTRRGVGWRASRRVPRPRDRVGPHVGRGQAGPR